MPKPGSFPISLRRLHSRRKIDSGNLEEFGKLETPRDGHLFDFKRKRKENHSKLPTVGGASKQRFLLCQFRIENGRHRQNGLQSGRIQNENDWHQHDCILNLF